jgi:hypothetical protein
MTTEVSMSGSGSVGEISPGWSVNEYATPVTIGETAGGTGNVSLTAAAKDDSLFAVNNNIATINTGLGSVFGVVQSVSQSGLSVSLNHNNRLAKFDADYNIPPLGAGGVVPALDLCSQIVGENIFLKPTLDGAYYSLQGHSAGFDSLGNSVVKETWSRNYQDYDSGSGQFYPTYQSLQNGEILGYDFSEINDKIYAKNVIGDNVKNVFTKPSIRLAGKFIIPDDDNRCGFTIGSTSANFLTSDEGAFYLNAYLVKSSNLLFIEGKYVASGFSANINVSQPTTGIDLTQEIAMFIDFKRPSENVDSGVHSFQVKICNTSNFATTVVATTSFTKQTYALYGFDFAWGAQGHVRSVWAVNDAGLPFSNSAEEYENESTHYIQGQTELHGPVPASNQNMWQYLQDACSAYNKELVLFNDTITVRDIGTKNLDITNIVGAPNISPTMSFAGRHVEVLYNNTRQVIDELIYDAEEDNLVLSVEAAQTVQTTVEISGSVSKVYPLRTSLGSLTLEPGQYYVSAGNGVGVPFYLWLQYGGDISLEVDDENPSIININLSGPISTNGIFNGATPLYPGPYKIAYVADNTEYPALKIKGDAVLFEKKTLKLLTGADWTKVVQDVSKTIENIFIQTEEQAYDRGMWASYLASGPVVTLSGSISSSEIERSGGFGVSVGSLIEYRNSTYRVTDLTIGNLNVSFNAVRHVTARDFDARWYSDTIGSHDVQWDGYDNSDHSIETYRGRSEFPNFYLGNDTDNSPYITTKESESYSLLYSDTDGKPFYSVEYVGGDYLLLSVDADMQPYYIYI